MNEKTEKASKRSWMTIWVSLIVVIPFSLLAVVVLLWIGREYSGARQLKTRIANLKKLGYPTDDASLDAQYKANTDPTNTAAWLELMETIKSPAFAASIKGVPYLEVDTEVPIQPQEPWAEERVSLAFRQQWKELYDKVLRLSIDAKPVRFPIVFDSYQTLLVQTEQIRQFAKVLQLHGRIGLRARDSAAVRESIDGLLGMSQVNAAEPNLVSALVTHNTDSIALGILKDAIQLDALCEVDLRILLPKLMAWSKVGPEWSDAVVGERALALPIYFDSKKAKAMGAASLPGRTRDALNYIEMSEKVLAIPTDRLSEINAHLEKTQIEQKITKGDWLEKFDTVLTGQLMPNYSGAVQVMIHRALQHRMAALAICIRLYEDRNSKLPDSLSELSEPAIDFKQLGPTDESSFGYQREGNRATLWGGNTRDLFTIPNEAPTPVDSDSTTAKNLWLWELQPKTQ